MARQQKGGAVSDSADTSGAVAGAVELVTVSGGTLVSLSGQKTAAASLPVVLASDQGAVTVTPAASENHLGEVGGRITNPTDSFNRPADTNAYASGDLISTTTVANTLTPGTLTVARVAAGSFMLRRVKLKKSGTSLTNASFRVHLYASAPTQTGAGGAGTGDNAAWSTSESGYLGSYDVTMDRAFTDGAAGFGAPSIGSEQSIALASGQTIRWLLEARAAYTPVSAETFTLTVEDLQN